MNQFDHETDETHDCESNSDRTTKLDVLCESVLFPLRSGLQRVVEALGRHIVLASRQTSDGL
jgi:hypothetical protein